MRGAMFMRRKVMRGRMVRVPMEGLGKPREPRNPGRDEGAFGGIGECQQQLRWWRRMEGGGQVGEIGVRGPAWW